MNSRIKVGKFNTESKRKSAMKNEGKSRVIPNLRGQVKWNFRGIVEPNM